jgi:catechol 2,3-dioxygenase-like lactoylglutathione lyase family enzyme
MKLEVVVVPVSDVDRAKTFYKALGWREDADFVTGARLPGRVTPALAVHDSAADLAGALRRAAAAHGKHEEETGRPDPDWPDWPDWYVQYMVDERNAQAAGA